MMKYNLYKIYSTTKCFNFKKYFTESLQQWAFCFVLKNRIPPSREGG